MASLWVLCECSWNIFFNCTWYCTLLMKFGEDEWTTCASRRICICAQNVNKVVCQLMYLQNNTWFKVYWYAQKYFLMQRTTILAWNPTLCIEIWCKNECSGNFGRWVSLLTGACKATPKGLCANHPLFYIAYIHIPVMGLEM